MLMLIFTYHQVMPAFLDFLFQFGRQQYAKDFHFSGFRQNTRLTRSNRGLRIPELGWSGREIQLCYSLKSAEPSKGQLHWPWSIRQSAVYHSFDLDIGRANWIFLKGDRLIKNRIKSATQNGCLGQGPALRSVDRAFATTLAIHMILCEWSSENWRWYINFLEDEFQATTRNTLTSIVETPSSPVVDTPSSPTMHHAPSRANTNVSKAPSESTLVQPYSPSKQEASLHPVAGQVAEAPIQYPKSVAPNAEYPEQPDFSFSDLQRLHFLEEKANETLLVLKTNMNVLTEMRQHYQYLVGCEDWPQDLQAGCKGDVFRFGKRITVVESDHKMQQWRVESLLRLIADRKSLVTTINPICEQSAADTLQLYGILQYRNMESSNFLAIKAQLSTRNMENMTKDTQRSTVNMEESTKAMHIIAQKTKQETVSMRIITLVTLFFLPFTFISVSLLLFVIRRPTD